MKTSSQIQNHFGSLTVLSIVLAVFLVSLTGLFNASDDHCYDFLQCIQPPARHSSGVLLVYTPSSFFDEKDCKQLSQMANELLSFEAKKIGFLFAPEEQQLSSLNEHPFAGEFVLGHSFPLPSEHVEPETPRPLKPTAEQGFLNFRLNQTVYRDHPIRIKGEGRTFDSVEFKLAKPFLPSEYTPPENLGIRFAGGQNGLPHITAGELLNHEIISELVRGKIVLIGPEPNEETGFATPTTRGVRRMSRLELHGNILNTLLNQNGFKAAGIPTACFVLLLTTLLFCQVFRQIGSGHVLTAYALSLVTVIVFSWLVLHFFSMKLPITSILVAASLVLLTSLCSRFEALKDVVDGWYLMRISGSADWKAEEKDTWTLISDSVYQIFYPNRMVLMELDSGASHLTVTKTIHCTPDDIFERRRDVNREPYRAAVQLGAATQIHNRQFFEINHDKNCIEFIAPLILVSELVGFMVLEMTADSVKNWDDFENFLTKFSSDMAVLASKYRILRQQESQQGFLLQRLKQVPEQHRKMSLFQAEVEHRNLERLLGDAFETIQTAGVIYDVFGRTIKTNAKMVELLQRNGVVVEDTDCISMLESLTRWNKNECRKLFRQCVVEGRTQQIFIPSENKRDAPRVLYLEPLNKGDDEPEISSRCVCIQVVEGKIFKESQVWQQEFVNNNLQQVNDRLEKLQKLADQIVNSPMRKSAPFEDRLTREIMESIAECRSILDYPFSEDPENHLGVDSRYVWESCLDKLRPKMDARCIKIVPRLDAGRLEVVANPFLLERIFETILECISHDACEDTEIIVSSEVVANKAYYHFCDNTGGVPLDDFRRSFDVAAGSQENSVEAVSLSVLTPSQIDQFREIETWLEAWDATLSIRCNKNYRINVELALKVKQDCVAHPNSLESHDILPNGT